MHVHGRKRWYLLASLLPILPLALDLCQQAMVVCPRRHRLSPAQPHPALFPASTCLCLSACPRRHRLSNTQPHPAFVPCQQVSMPKHLYLMPLTVAYLTSPYPGSLPAGVHAQAPVPAATGCGLLNLTFPCFPASRCSCPSVCPRRHRLSPAQPHPALDFCPGACATPCLSAATACHLLNLTLPLMVSPAFAVFFC